MPQVGLVAPSLHTTLHTAGGCSTERDHSHLLNRLCRGHADPGTIMFALGAAAFKRALLEKRAKTPAHLPVTFLSHNVVFHR
jgi:hypothetical protein